VSLFPTRFSGTFNFFLFTPAAVTLEVVEEYFFEPFLNFFKLEIAAVFFVSSLFP